MDTVYSKSLIENYELLWHGGISYLIYKLHGESKPKAYAVDVSSLGDISIEEYILCKEKTMEELMIRRYNELDKLEKSM